MPFISFSCLFALAEISNTLLNNSGKTGHPCLVPDLRGKAFSFSLLNVMSAEGLSFMAFVMLRCSPFILTLLRAFIINGCWILSNAFSTSTEMIMSFILHLVHDIDSFASLTQ